MSKGLTISVIFDAMSLNYGEGIGNISELKKLSRSGEVFSYLSRQAIRFDIYRMLKETFRIDNGHNPLTPDERVVQFKPDVSIKDCMEADLFGYMKTKKTVGAVTRPAVIRISPAVSLEPFSNDLEWGTNKNFADRAGVSPNPFQFEHHSSLYSYTVTIDLDRIGKDENEKPVVEIEKAEKAQRVCKFIEIIKVLNRDIKGRTESLNPVFAIGGIYNVKNPFFLNRLKITYNRDLKKYFLNTGILESVVSMSFNQEKIKDNTIIGYLSDFWGNQDYFNDMLNHGNLHNNINSFFEELKKKAENYYMN